MQRPIDRVAKHPDPRPQAGIFGDRPMADRLAGGEQAVHAAIDSHLSLWHAPKHHDDLPGGAPHPPEVGRKRYGVADHDVSGREVACDPQAPEEIEQEVAPKLSRMIEARQADHADAVDGFTIRKSRPCAGEECDFVPGGRELPRQPEPDLLRGPARHGRHGEEEAGNNRDFHRWTDILSERWTDILSER